MSESWTDRCLAFALLLSPWFYLLPARYLVSLGWNPTWCFWGRPPWFWVFSCERLRNHEECFLIPTLGFMRTPPQTWGFPCGLVVKNPPSNVGDAEDACLIPGSGRSPGGGNGNALQYSCLKNPKDGGAWWATVPGVTKSWTQLSD